MTAPADAMAPTTMLLATDAAANAPHEAAPPSSLRSVAHRLIAEDDDYDAA